MKKFIAVLAIALFVGSLSAPTFAVASHENIVVSILDGKPKKADKKSDSNTDCSTAKKADCKTAKKADCNTPCSTAEKKACNGNDKK